MLKKLLSLLFFLFWIPSAFALTPAPPAWVQKFNNPRFFFDFANNRCYRCSMWYGKNSGTNTYSTGFVFYNGSSVTPNTLYVQWKDGLVRPATPVSSGTQVLRLSDYGLWTEGTSWDLADNVSTSVDNTNSLLQNRIWSGNKWTPTNITLVSAAIVGADGTSGSATQLTASAANGTIVQGPVNIVPQKATVTVGGVSYAVNDTINLTGTGCTVYPQMKVLTVSSGVIQTAKINNYGSIACTSEDLSAMTQSSTSGSGSGATFTMVWGAYCPSVWMKRITGSGAVSLTMDNSAYTDISASLSTSRFTQVSLSPSSSPSSFYLGVKMATQNDVVVVDFGQVENNDSTCTSPILATAATNTRGDEYSTLNTPGTNYNPGAMVISAIDNNTPFSIYIAYSGNFSTTAAHGLFVAGGGTNSFQINGSAGGGAVSGKNNNVTTTSSNSDTSGLLINTGTGALNKVVYGSDGAHSFICLNGVYTSGSTAIRTTASGTTHITFGNNGSNLQPLNGYEKEVGFWTRALTQGECQQISSVVNNQ